MGFYQNGKKPIDQGGLRDGPVKAPWYSLRVEPSGDFVKLAFIDMAPWDYDAETPLNRPLGGTQSAAVYLAAELAALGHEIVFINDVKAPHVSRQVQFLNANAIDGQFLNQFDAIVSISSAMGLMFRREIGVTKPLILWLQHAPDQPSVQKLKDADERDAWTALAMVSAWQAESYHRQFAIPRELMVVKHNAVSPVFLEKELPAPWFMRDAPPVLTYTSTPFRGLDVLLMAFPTIRKAIPEARLRVFSSMATYQVPSDKDTYGILYELCRALPGVEYIGALPQRDLANALSGVAALSYPSTFAETSCISVMEAMASGAMILSTELGALPETAHGFGQLLPLKGNRLDIAGAYAAMVIDALEGARAQPQETAAKLNDQVQFVRAHYTWAARAREWQDWLASLLANPSSQCIPASN